MKIVFFGSDDFGLPTLDALAASEHQLVGVVSQPDRPAGRGRHLHPTAVAAWALERHLPLIRPERVNRPEPMAELARWGGEIGVVIGFGQKIGNPLLASYPHSCINLHASLLPKYRGAAPVAWSIINGETTTGLTIFRLVERMDAGPIVYRAATPIDPLETAGELRHRLALLGPGAMLAALAQIGAGRAEFAEQDESLATPAPKLSKADGIIDWNQSAVVIANRVRGLYPWPGAKTLYMNRTGRTEELVVARAEPVAASAVSQRGLEVGVLREDLTVSAGLGTVRLLEVKPAGARLMRFDDFVNGRRVRPGDRMMTVPMPSLPEGLA